MTEAAGLQAPCSAAVPPLDIEIGLWAAAARAVEAAPPLTAPQRDVLRALLANRRGPGVAAG